MNRIISQAEWATTSFNKLCLGTKEKGVWSSKLFLIESTKQELDQIQHKVMELTTDVNTFPAQKRILLKRATPPDKQRRDKLT